MRTLASFVIVPMFLIAGVLYLFLLIAVACGAVAAVRWARLRVQLARRVRVPRDGAPLKDWESRAFTGIRGGWGRQAGEPAYDQEQEW